MHTHVLLVDVYGWNHRNTTWTSIQISQLLEWVRPRKWVRSKAMGHVYSPKYTIARDILYLLISQQNFRQTSIQISDGENSFMRKFWWKIFFVRFLIMKKVYIIWSHELIEKLDFYGLFYRHGDFFPCVSWNSHFRVIIKKQLFFIYVTIWKETMIIYDEIHAFLVK